MAIGKLSGGRKAVLETAASGRLSALLDRHGKQDDDLDLREVLQALDAPGVRSLCQSLESQVEAALSATEVYLHTSEEGAWEPAAVENLSAAAAIVLMMLEEAMTPAGLLALHPVAVTLHDAVLLAAAEHPDLQNAVSRFCELWWQQGLEGKEAMVAQTLPFLLVRSLTSGKAVDVKRCHAMREAFLLLDYEDPSIIDLKKLLLRAAFAPPFLRSPPGRRFLSFLFTIHPLLVRELAAIIRNQVLSGRQSVLEAYGEVLFRAWRDATGPCLLEIEDIVQELMKACILAAEPSLSAALRTVLGGFHNQKHVRGVDSLLLRLYEPILFRALSSPNASVRCNSLHTLCAAFPLQDPELEATQVDELLTRQFGMLGDCLDDPVPLVRKAAAGVTCTLLNVWWELVPSATAAQFLKRLAGLAYDSTSSNVRVAAISGLSDLVDNALAQPLLKVVLPTLAALIDDTSVKVHLALVNLLMVVRSVRALHFWEIVPVEKLLAAMAGGSRDVAARLQQLLLPSYFPEPVEGAARVAGLLKHSPAAGRAFCAALARSQAGGSGGVVPLEQVAALIDTFRDHLLRAAQQLERAPVSSSTSAAGAKRKGGNRRAAKGEEAEEVETEAGWEAVAGGLAELCTGLAEVAGSGVRGAAAVAEVLDVAFDHGGLAYLLAACPSARARVSVLAIAAALPELPASSEVRGRCLVSLVAEAGLADVGRQEETAGLLASVAAGDTCTARLLDMLRAALEDSGGDVTPSDASRPDAPQSAPIAGMGEIHCRKCGSARDADALLLCDGCNAGYHTRCLSLKKVPEGDWFCVECAAVLDGGLTPNQAVAYVGLMLQQPTTRAALAPSLPQLLTSLIRLVRVRGSRLATDVATGSSSAGAASLPDLVSVMGRSALHIAVMGSNVLEAPQRVEAVDAALQVAVSVATDLHDALRHAVVEAAATDSSPAHKRSKSAVTDDVAGGGPATSAAIAAEALLCILSVFGEAALLRLPGWHSPPFCQLAQQASTLATRALAAARKLSASPWTASAPLAALLDPVLAHVAKFARHSIPPPRDGASSVTRLFHTDESDTSAAGAAATQGAAPGLRMLAGLVQAAAGAESTDKRCLAILKPFLPGLIRAAANTGTDVPDATLWLEPLLHSIGDVFSGADVGEEELDLTEFIQEVAVLQPLVHSAKFLSHAKPLAAQAATASVTLLQQGDAVAALGGAHLLSLLGVKEGSAKFVAAMPQLEALRAAVATVAVPEDEEGDGEMQRDALESLRRMPLFRVAEVDVEAA